MSLNYIRALPLLTLLALACGPAEPEFAAPNTELIDRANVERVITTLAADDMRGRRAFTEDAMRAASFLAGEFDAAGLTAMPAADGFLQRFAVRSIATRDATVTIAGTAMPADRVMARLGAESIAWETGDVKVVVVAAADSAAQQSILAALRGDSDALVLVHPSHTGLMQNLGRFLRGAVRLMPGEDAISVVVVLSDGGADAAYSIRASAVVTEEGLANVAGMIPGVRADEYVLFSAHYDHIGVRPGSAPDSIANGANDDASGTTAVVELAKYYAARGTPERTLLFAAFTAEEGGGYGSRFYSQQLDPDQIVAMFNIEMIGKPAVEGPNTAWVTGWERSSFGPLLEEAVAGTGYTFYPDPYPTQNLFYRSDNATLARLGVPAHSISTTPIDVDPDYHQVTDHVETLDLDHLTNTIRAIATAAETMVTGLVAPTRVDPATVN